MNLDLTSSSSRTQKSTIQKKSYKPRKSNTKNTRKSYIEIQPHPPYHKKKKLNVYFTLQFLDHNQTTKMVVSMSVEKQKEELKAKGKEY